MKKVTRNISYDIKLGNLSPFYIRIFDFGERIQQRNSRLCKIWTVSSPSTECEEIPRRFLAENLTKHGFRFDANVSIKSENLIVEAPAVGVLCMSLVRAALP